MGILLASSNDGSKSGVRCVSLQRDRLNDLDLFIPSW